LSTKKLVIAIDGPAASGKSTTARLVADRLGYLYVDTGAMYRAITLKVLRKGVPPDDILRVEEMARSARVELKRERDGLRVLLDDEDVTEEIRQAEVTRTVSAISSIRGVRAVLVAKQRIIGGDGGVVLEGRDIGTVVFPGADLKIFMVADLDARSKRRAREMERQGAEMHPKDVGAEIELRDRLDSSRNESPLIKASDAIELDTSALTIEEQVEFVVNKATEILLKAG
jgi:cytidylate kinase